MSYPRFTSIKHMTLSVITFIKTHSDQAPLGKLKSRSDIAGRQTQVFEAYVSEEVPCVVQDSQPSLLLICLPGSSTHRLRHQSN